ncbi:MAG: DUF1501 domain-containing protein [Planctomycetes bacterium]|nr:DUF1501 domain-containing protein [Planctomycetota bacterium]
MLRWLGSSQRSGTGWTRRELLRAGSLGAAGLTLPELLRTEHERSAAAAVARGAGFGQAKRCVILYLYGAASQLETFDPKPDAPVEVRNVFDTIETTTPGLRISEHLPRLAKVLDRCTVVRSMTHPYNIHSAAYTLSGIPAVDVGMELNPNDRRHWPYLGSVLEYLAERQGTHRASQIPSNMALPFQFSSRSPEFTRAGPYGAFLGHKYDPVWTEFEGEPTKSVARWRGNTDRDVAEPYLGIASSGRFTLPGAATLQAGMTLDRLATRRSLLEQFDDQRRDLHQATAVQTRDRFQEMAFSLISSGAMRTALDIDREPQEVRERYGMTLFGQATLAARRLIEAGGRLVTVFWDEIVTANSAWDTHFDQVERLRDELLPGLDMALSSLLLDLEARGMLDDTLVCCITEHGRTPKLDRVRGGGRGHWSRAYSGLFAGGGIARQRVIGRTDQQAGDVVERPVSPKDILSTMYHLLGVDSHTLVHDGQGRPYPLVADGELVGELLA